MKNMNKKDIDRLIKAYSKLSQRYKLLDIEKAMLAGDIYDAVINDLNTLKM